MFSGIIQALGRVESLGDSKSAGGQQADQRFRISSDDAAFAQASIGASIAVNGVCLTVVTSHEDGFSVDVSQATLDCTSLQHLAVDQPVNLEPALRMGDPLDGHLVSGHVDGVGHVESIVPVGGSQQLTISVPNKLLPLIAPKGSICIDGVSLTVNEVTHNKVTVNIVPHTAQVTIIGTYQVGQRVNIEIDLIARYLAQLVKQSNSEFFEYGTE